MFSFLKSVFLPSPAAPVSQLELQLRTVSIRGRLAYCTTCLETAFLSEKINLDALGGLLCALWEFTSSSDLGVWEEKIINYYSESVLEEQSDEQNGLISVPFQQLKAAYSALPAGLLQCIDETIDVGRGNLYGGTVGHSADTLTPTTQVVRYMQASGYPLPPIERFLRSPFTQEDQHGWGKRVARSYFQ